MAGPFSMKHRAAGILMHPSSLPGPFAIGDIGPSAHRFLEWLAQAKQTIWQFLPLGPVGSGFSPYAALSSFAGSSLLISPELLVRDAFLDPQSIDVEEPGRRDRVDYPAATVEKTAMLRSAWRRFRADEGHALRGDFDSFCLDDEHASWLDDWCLFVAIRQARGQQAWWTWPTDLKERDPGALVRERECLAGEVKFHAFEQFLFYRQWNELRDKARDLGVQLLGDLPIYVALDSADVWSHPHLFDLDDQRRPLLVAGVPPDYFSEDGQLWGNPIYDWKRHEQDHFSWWIERISASLQLTDLLRIDHFRAFESFWAVPADHDTARNGEWQKGPGMQLFHALSEALGDLPLIAEDLGEITDEVRELRKQSGLPGMRVLQFGFDEDDNEHAPHRYAIDTVAYTGTHDNDTLVGWFHQQASHTRRRVLQYCGGRKRRIHWDLMRLLHTSSAGIAIVPIQDVLGLGSEARMNVPGEEGGNWSFRSLPGALDERLARRLSRLTKLSGRIAPPDEDGA